MVSKTFNRENKTAMVICGVLFSIWPDLDLIYFYLFDSTKTFHHYYIPHLPAAMLAALLLSAPLFICVRPVRPYYKLFFINWALHLVLDCYTGGIAWLYPIRPEIYKLIDSIPEIHPSWYISFILHPSFLVELAVLATAIFVFLLDMKKRKQSHNGAAFIRE